MQIKDRTKHMFAQALVEMLADVPLEKVRVTKLCARCGAAMPTFYYHFRDKYELVVWIFLQDILAVDADCRADGGRISLDRILRQVEQKKTFYQRAFTDQSQNSLGEYIHGFIVRYYKAAVRDAAGEEPTPEQLFAIRYHTCGVIGMFREWLFGQDADAGDLTRLLFERMPDFMQRASAVCPLSAADIHRLLDSSGGS